MEKENMDELWSLFQETEMTKFLYHSEEVENAEEKEFFNTLYNLRLQQKQKQIINQDKFVM
ncbi:hypothetical protein ACRCJU_09515 [Aerococcus urinaeequi]|uniref:hypothetical protein n=1 Tax=Aerococcus urinaeequi TaxID=51665 RepID=UPI003D6C5822